MPLICPFCGENIDATFRVLRRLGCIATITEDGCFPFQDWRFSDAPLICPTCLKPLDSHLMRDKDGNIIAIDKDQEIPLNRREIKLRAF